MQRIEKKSTTADRDVLLVWDDYTEFCNGWKTICNKTQRGQERCGSSDKDWVGNRTRNDNGTYTEELISRGDHDSIAYIESMMSKIEKEVGLADTYTNRWSLNVAGSFPCVPAYLAGEPDCMFQQSEQETNDAVTVYFCTSSSASISAQEIMKRGAVIATLVLLLARVRPVKLVAFDTLDARKDGVSKNFANLIPLPHSPLSVPHLASAMCKVAFARVACYGVGYSEGFTGGWARAWTKDDNGKRAGLPNTREFIGARSNDIIIGAASIYDELSKDPIRWVKQRLKSQGITVEGEENE